MTVTGKEENSVKGREIALLLITRVSAQRRFIGFSFCPLVCPIGVARFDVAPVIIDTHSPACVFSRQKNVLLR